MKVTEFLKKRNIYFRGQFISETDLIGDSILPDNAVMFREGESIKETFTPGFFTELPLLILMIRFTIVRYMELKMHFQLNVSFVLIVVGSLILLNWLLTYVHEILHGLFYPKEAEKTILKDKKAGLWFIHCGAVVSRKRFFVVGMAPVFFLGIQPFGIWYLLAPVLPQPWSLIWVLTCWYMVLGSMGDFCNILNLVLQVPPGAKVLNYGIHSYWLKPEGYQPGRIRRSFENACSRKAKRREKERMHGWKRF